VFRTRKNLQQNNTHFADYFDEVFQADSTHKANNSSSYGEQESNSIQLL